MNKNSNIRICFTLVLCLTLALPMLLIADDIDVPAGANAISTAFAAAVDGDVLILSTDGGVYTEDAALVIDKRVTIKAGFAFAKKPVWTTAAGRHITVQNDLMLEGILFDGADATSFAIVNEGQNLHNLSINKCDFRGFTDHTISQNPGTVDTLSISNVLIHDGAGSGINLPGDQAGQVPGVNYGMIDHSTIYNMGGDGINIAGYRGDGGSTTVMIDYVTVYKATGSGITLKATDANSFVRNCVVTHSNNGVVGGDGAALNVTYSDVWGSAVLDYDGAVAGMGVFSHDPWYAEADTGNFQYGWSQFHRASSEQRIIGDLERHGRWRDAPPRLALNTIGPGTLTADPVKEVYDFGDVVTLTATPNAGAEFIGWIGDSVGTSATEQLTMESHRYVTAQFAPVGAEIVDVNGTFGTNTDWSVVALELLGTGVKFEEVQHGEVLLASSPDTMTVTSDSSITMVDGDYYFAVLSTKSFSHGHPHNTQVVDEVTGLGLTWTHVATQRASRNQTVLNVYMATGSPSGDGLVSATLHHFPAGFVIALSVVRYSGATGIGNMVSHNRIGFDGPGVEVTGYPRISSSTDNTEYSVKLPLTATGSSVIAFIAQRDRSHVAGDGLIERDEFKVLSGGNTNSITIVDFGLPFFPKEILVDAGPDAISAALATASYGDIIVLNTDGGVYEESETLIIDKLLTIKAGFAFFKKPVWKVSAGRHLTVKHYLMLEGIVFDGADATGSAIVNMGQNPNNLSINKCEFKGFTDHTISQNPGTVDSLWISNVLIHDGAGSGINLPGDQAGQVPGVNYGMIDHTTIYNMGGDGINIAGYRGDGGSTTVMIDYVTVYKATGSGITLKATDANSFVRNCVVTHSNNGVVGGDGAALNVTFSNVWGNTVLDYDGAVAGMGVFSHDPWYAEADTGNFQYGWSQFHRASSEKRIIGDLERHGRWRDAPPRLALNTIGPGTLTADPVKEVYDFGDVVTLTATPNAGAEFIGWIGDSVGTSATEQLTMDAHRYVTAQFAPTGAEIVDVNGTFGSNTDWSIVALELLGTNVTFEEVQHGEVLLASSPDTMTVTSDSSITMVDGDYYFAVLSTKSFSHGHPHNTQVVDEVTGLGLTWTHVATQRASRNQTVLNVYMATGSPSGDGLVSATLHHFPAGFVIALSVVRYSGATGIGNMVSHNRIGFDGPGVEVTGYPRISSSTDNTEYSVKLPLTAAGSSVIAFIAQRDRSHEPGEGLFEREEFKVLSGGNTNSITIVEHNVLTTDVNELDGIPITYNLFQNYPNPFNPTTTITFSIPVQSKVKLTVYSITGQVVRKFDENDFAPGYHKLTWNGDNQAGLRVASGIYFYKIEAVSLTNEANRFIQVQKMLMLK